MDQVLFARALGLCLSETTCGSFVAVAEHGAARECVDAEQCPFLAAGGRIGGSWFRDVGDE